MTDHEAEAAPVSVRALEGFRPIGFFTADYATVESGKVYASGAYWTHLKFPTFPATLSSCAIVAVVQIPWHAQHADHLLEVRLLDSDSRDLPLEIRGEFRAASGIDARYGEPGVLPVAIPVFGLSFDRPGDFAFVLFINGKEVGRYPFRVMQVATPTPAPRQPPPTAEGTS